MVEQQILHRFSDNAFLLSFPNMFSAENKVIPLATDPLRAHSPFAKFTYLSAPNFSSNIKHEDFRPLSGLLLLLLCNAQTAPPVFLNELERALVELHIPNIGRAKKASAKALHRS